MIGLLLFHYMFALCYFSQNGLEACPKRRLDIKGLEDTLTSNNCWKTCDIQFIIVNIKMNNQHVR